MQDTGQCGRFSVEGGDRRKKTQHGSRSWKNPSPFLSGLPAPTEVVIDAAKERMEKVPTLKESRRFHCGAGSSQTQKLRNWGRWRELITKEHEGAS